MAYQRNPLVSILCTTALLSVMAGPAIGQTGLGTTNSSTLTNSAAPSASSITTGGTNINYQSNNTFNNEMGFGPGIFCRTPSIYVGGSWGESNLDAFDPIQRSGNATKNLSANAGVVVPFGSQIIDYCKQIAFSIARDREISSQLSMLRTCRELEREGLVVDPVKFPLLSPCVKSIKSPATARIENDSKILSPSKLPAAMPALKPKTTRLL